MQLKIPDCLNHKGISLFFGLKNKFFKELHNQ